MVSAEGTLDSEFIRTPGGRRAGTAKDGARVVVLAERTEGGGWEVLWILGTPKLIFSQQLTLSHLRLFY